MPSPNIWFHSKDTFFTFYWLKWKRKICTSKKHFNMHCIKQYYVRIGDELSSAKMFCFFFFINIMIITTPAKLRKLCSVRTYLVTETASKRCSAYRQQIGWKTSDTQWHWRTSVRINLYQNSVQQFAFIGSLCCLQLAPTVSQHLLYRLQDKLCEHVQE